MSGAAAPVGFGLLSAASWGGADFAGGLGSRRAPALLVTAAGQLVSLGVLAAVCAVAHLALPTGRPAALMVIAGFEGAIALALFYRALAMGAMGLTAALTGLLTAIVPVCYSAIFDGLPGRVTAMGLAVGLVSIWLITHESGAETPRRALALGSLAGVGFGTQLVLFRMAEGGMSNLGWQSAIGTMTVVRVAGVSALLLLLAVTRTGIRGGGFWVAGALSGVFDAAGNLFFLAASSAGRLDAAAVICSLYPAGTILLAAMVLGERPKARQIAGMALALVAVALLSR